MPIDPYSPCPGGTGKKVKFCCTDLQQELDKVERMLEGEQSKACLDYVRKLDEKYTGRACLQSIRISLENAMGDHAAAHATLATFLKQHPDNPVALAEQALDLAAHGDPLGGILWLQQALEICREEMPARVYDAVGAWRWRCCRPAILCRPERTCNCKWAFRKGATNGRFPHFCNSRDRRPFRCR